MVGIHIGKSIQKCIERQQGNKDHIRKNTPLYDILIISKCRRKTVYHKSREKHGKTNEKPAFEQYIIPSGLAFFNKMLHSTLKNNLGYLIGKIRY